MDNKVMFYALIIKGSLKLTKFQMVKSNWSHGLTIILKKNEITLNF